MSQIAHAARMIRADMERAGLPIVVEGEGHVDFHALRTTYLTLLDMNGATAKESQDLARHATPIVTFSSYIRSNDERKQRVVEAVGSIVHEAGVTQQEPTGEEGALHDLPNAM
jgi:integrase